MTSLPLAEIWDKRSLILHFSLMNVRLRYKGTNLGFLWNVLEPLFTFLVLYVVFVSIKEMPENFAIYLLTGVMLYHVFARGSLAGIGSLRNNKNFLTTLNIKNEFYPVTAVGSIKLTTIVEMAVFVALLPILNFTPSITLLFLPIPIFLMLIFIWGLTYLLSIVNVYFRDLSPMWAIVIHAFFFISPIFWYVSEVEGILLDVMKFNPVGQIIELAHQVVVFGNIPPLGDWLYTSAIVFGVFFFGFAIFRKFEKHAVEEL